MAKRDIQQINALAKRFRIDRIRLSNLIHELKESEGIKDDLTFDQKDGFIYYRGKYLANVRDADEYN